MKQIIQANEAIMGILGKEKTSASGYRMMHYCISTEVEEGVLLFNVLTRELLLLTPEEYANVLELPYFRKQWFVVPEETNEKKLVETVRWVQKCMTRESKHITSYTILTTTDCNARCFYCYEKGLARVAMSEETAMKTVEFIKANCGGKKVRLAWFGGEPLFNHGVIDLICDRLRQDGIEFYSTMISNGYLFDDEMVEKAATSWNLKHIQITLDGTEDVYNRSKAYIYKEGSAYQIVMENIGRLLSKDITIDVRMNMDFYNAEDLLELTEILAKRFKGHSKLRAYSHLLFNEDTSWDKRYTAEKWDLLYEAQRRLHENMERLGIIRKGGLKRKLPHNFCMADNDHAILITPSGNLTVCEHFTDDEMVGHIDSPERDQAVIAKFRQRMDEIPECATCFFYPECIRLKKCVDLNPCISPERESRRRQVQKAMVNEFRRWKENIEDDDEMDIDVNC